eukprot:Sspe_Gene.117793::Locus_109723_Transcript_1_1_Confidence_1.000_Length_3592::g.117793::m.117793
MEGVPDACPSSPESERGVPKLRPSCIGRYIQHGCERYLTLIRNNGYKDTKWGSDDFGFKFEKLVEEALELPLRRASNDLTNENCFDELVAALEGLDGIFLCEVRLKPSGGMMDLISTAKPDLLKVERKDDGALKVTVYEIKSALSLKASAQGQVATYRLILENMLAGKEVEMATGVYHRKGDGNIHLHTFECSMAQHLCQQVLQLYASPPSDPEWTLGRKCIMCEYLPTCRADAKGTLRSLPIKQTEIEDLAQAVGVGVGDPTGIQQAKEKCRDGQWKWAHRRLLRATKDTSVLEVPKLRVNEHGMSLVIRQTRSGTEVVFACYNPPLRAQSWAAFVENGRTTTCSNRDEIIAYFANLLQRADQSHFQLIAAGPSDENSLKEALASADGDTSDAVLVQEFLKSLWWCDQFGGRDLINDAFVPRQNAGEEPVDEDSAMVRCWYALADQNGQVPRDVRPEDTTRDVCTRYAEVLDITATYDGLKELRDRARNKYGQVRTSARFVSLYDEALKLLLIPCTGFAMDSEVYAALSAKYTSVRQIDEEQKEKEEPELVEKLRENAKSASLLLGWLRRTAAARERLYGTPCPYPAKPPLGDANVQPYLRLQQQVEYDELVRIHKRDPAVLVYEGNDEFTMVTKGKVYFDLKTFERGGYLVEHPGAPPFPDEDYMYYNPVFTRLPVSGEWWCFADLHKEPSDDPYHTRASGKRRMFSVRSSGGGEVLYISLLGWFRLRQGCEYHLRNRYVRDSLLGLLYPDESERLRQITQDPHGFNSVSPEPPLSDSLLCDGAERLSDEQRRAVQAVARNRLCVICGPAGTGKSHTLASAVVSMVRHAEAQGVKLWVLVASQNSAPLDVVRPQLEKAIPSKLTKKGESPGEVAVWCASLRSVTRSSNKYPRRFDVLAIEEGSQVHIFDLPLIVAHLEPRGRLLVVGDSRQMQASRKTGHITQRTSNGTLRSNVLESLLMNQEREHVALLTGSFRSHKTIVQFLQRLYEITITPRGPAEMLCSTSPSRNPLGGLLTVEVHNEDNTPSVSEEHRNAVLRSLTKMLTDEYQVAPEEILVIVSGGARARDNKWLSTEMVQGKEARVVIKDIDEARGNRLADESLYAVSQLNVCFSRARTLQILVVPPTFVISLKTIDDEEARDGFAYLEAFRATAPAVRATVAADGTVGWPTPFP